MKLIDITGQRFTRLVAVSETERNRVKQRQWLCQCDCGKTAVILMASLRRGNTQSCGCLGIERLKEKSQAMFLDLVGQRFGRLEVLRRSTSKPNKPHWECRCDCGQVVTVRGDCLRDGNTQSCGCLSIERTREAHTTHGHSPFGGRSPEYYSWSNMLNRVNDRKGRNFIYYGARGITVCDRWRSFENFLTDMGPRPAGKSLDRIDNNGNYEPGNCRWVTQSEQLLNRRSAAQCRADRATALRLLEERIAS